MNDQAVAKVVPTFLYSHIGSFPPCKSAQRALCCAAAQGRVASRLKSFPHSEVGDRREVLDPEVTKSVTFLITSKSCCAFATSFAPTKASRSFPFARSPSD